MKFRDRRKAKGRAESGGFFALPHAVMMSQAFRSLSAQAVKLLCDVGGQFRGKNNGDLCVTWRVMERLGWRSRDTLTRALRELRDAGFIELTRQGGLNRCSLYALTWRPIDDCGGKLDVAPTKVASNAWRDRPSLKSDGSSTPSVLVRHGGRDSVPLDARFSTRQTG